MMEVENENPVVYAAATGLKLHGDDAETPEFDVRDDREAFTAQEVFAHIRHLNDPEHPLTLEQLHVVCLEHIYVDDVKSTVRVLFTPTIPHCSMATLIGLCIRVKLLRSMPSRFKISVQIFPGAHQSEVAVNKQLADKERVAAALENGHLLDVVTKCIEDTDR
jgi:metal-sulfur cluster biosynthetic enzyme